MTSKKT